MFRAVYNLRAIVSSFAPNAIIAYIQTLHRFWNKSAYRTLLSYRTLTIFYFFVKKPIFIKTRKKIIIKIFHIHHLIFQKNFIFKIQKTQLKYFFLKLISNKNIKQHKTSAILPKIFVEVCGKLPELIFRLIFCILINKKVKKDDSKAFKNLNTKKFK